MSYDTERRATAEKAVRLFSVAEKLLDAKVMNKGISAQFGITIEDLALIRLRELNKYPLSEEEQVSLPKVTNFLIAFLRGLFAGDIEESPEFTLRIFEAIGILNNHDMNVMSAIDKQMMEQTGLNWEKIALIRAFKKEATEEKLNQVTQASMYLRAILSNLLEE